MTEPKRSVIHVPKDLDDIFPEFLENRRVEIAAMPGVLERRDFKQLRTWGHNMAGCGEGYGFPSIGELGRCLENAALAQDVAAIQICTAKMAELVTDIVVVYD